jgi:hypothetical protein
MTTELIVLSTTAATIGFFHTLFGPDHYVPFIFMAKARRWTILKTSIVTIACGLGHVGSSILVGTIGIIFGLAVGKLELFEGFRGNIAALAFIAFGLVYFIWGLRRATSIKPHRHTHFHQDGTLHSHDHNHLHSHDHLHKQNITPWILFTIFVLGPCEPLIPILMYPASEFSFSGLFLICTLFSSVTIATMLVLVLSATFGLSFLHLGKLEKYSHALAGGIIMISGLGIIFLGL